MNNVKNTIGWADYTWNPITGCKRGCSYCYAKKIFDRFNPKDKFSDIVFHLNRQREPYKIIKPSKIFVGSMSDICYWDTNQMNRVMIVVKENPQHTFMFLTKQPEIYANYKFPKNCWLGKTIDNDYPKCYGAIINDNISFISFEPLIKEPLYYHSITEYDWIIVGGLSPKPIHKKEWIDKIVKYCKRKNIPLFIKNNAKYPIEIKQFPKEKK